MKYFAALCALLVGISAGADEVNKRGSGGTGGGGGSDGIGAPGPKGLFTATGPNTAVPNAVFAFGNLGLTPTINWAQGETQVATIDQASANFAPFVGGLSGGNYTLILTQDSSPGTLFWPAAVRWPSGMGPTINMDANSVTLVHCFYDGTNYNCIGGVAGASFSQDTADPTTGNPACGFGDIRANSTTGALFWCSDDAADEWSMIGEYTADPAGFVSTMKFHALDIDDAPGVADAAGADPNPPPWSRAGTWYSGAFPLVDAYSTESIFTPASWNYGGSAVVNPFLPTWAFSMEPAFGAGNRSGTEQQEAYIQWGLPQYRVVIASGGLNAISLGMNLTFTGGEVCRPVNTDADLSNGAVVSMVCSNAAGTARDAPDNTDVITACTGPASPAPCSPMPAGTVSGTPLDQNIAIRPFFLECQPTYPGCTWKMERGLTATGTVMYWSLASSGDNTYHLGNGGYSDTNFARVSINASDSTGLCTVGPGCTGGPLIQDRGDFAVDTSDGGTFDGTNTVGGQWRFATNQFVSESLSPIKNACASFNLVSSTSDDVNFPFTTWQKTTIVAMGCRDDTTASPTTAATMALETVGGTSVPLTSTLTCSGNASAMAWQTASTPWMNQASNAGSLASGGGVRFDTTNTPNPAIDSYTVCIAYRDTGK